MKLRNLFMAVMAGAALLVGCNKEVDQGPASLDVKTSELNLTSAETTEVVTFVATRDWVVSGIPDWMNASDESGVASDKEQSITLYVDENTIDLPESEWVTDNNGRVLKTLGRRNLYYEKSMYNMNAQPYYVIIDAEGKVLTQENYKYDRDVQKFIAYLNEGLSNYKK